MRHSMTQGVRDAKNVDFCVRSLLNVPSGHSNKPQPMVVEVWSEELPESGRTGRIRLPTVIQNMENSVQYR